MVESGSFPPSDIRYAEWMGIVTKHIYDENLFGIEIIYNPIENHNCIYKFENDIPILNNKIGLLNSLKIQICDANILQLTFNQLNKFLSKQKEHKILVIDVICNPTLFSSELKCSLKHLLNIVREAKFFDSTRILQQESKTIISDSTDLDALLFKSKDSKEVKENTSINIHIEFSLLWSQYVADRAEKNNQVLAL